MIAKVIKIGNSKGVRIPKHLLEESGVENEVEIEVKGNNIILRPSHEARKNWDAAFQSMSENEDDVLLDKEHLTNSTSWDKEEWDW